MFLLERNGRMHLVASTGNSAKVPEEESGCRTASSYHVHAFSIHLKPAEQQLMVGTEKNDAQIAHVCKTHERYAVPTPAWEA